jgi:pyridoxamine 5'-phosphate oxidase
MIKFVNSNNSIPLLQFRKLYEDALSSKQQNIEAISISSFNKNKQEVNSRLVNLKFIDDEEFIFFTNYNSPKSVEFALHPQISALLFWPSINTQIRLKGNVKKKSPLYNADYFKSRSKEKNALALSSNQSQVISSYELIKEKYENSKEKYDLTMCPDYWGGFAFTPYEIEFWEGNKFRLNKRNLYKKNNNTWDHFILEP